MRWTKVNSREECLVYKESDGGVGKYVINKTSIGYNLLFIEISKAGHQLLSISIDTGTDKKKLKRMVQRLESEAWADTLDRVEKAQGSKIVRS